MKDENRTPLTLLEACTLLARETVSLLESSDQIPTCIDGLMTTLALASSSQTLDDNGVLAGWVCAEYTNAKRFAETGERTESLIKMNTPLPMPDPAMQIDAVCTLLKAAIQNHITPEQWQTVLDAMRTITEMDDLDGMIVTEAPPAGGFLTAGNLRNLLETVQAAFREAHKRLYAEASEQVMT